MLALPALKPTPLLDYAQTARFYATPKWHDTNRRHEEARKTCQEAYLSRNLGQMTKQDLRQAQDMSWRAYNKNEAVWKQHWQTISALPQLFIAV